jgi:protein-disulfide isomerase
MTYESTGSNPNPRREDAREKARSIREQQKKIEKRNRAMARGIIVFGIIAVAGIVALIITTTVRDPASGPLNMRSDGIIITEKLHAVETGAIRPGQAPVPTVPDPDSDVIAIVLYVDYFSPLAAAFQETNGSHIRTLLETGAVTLEVHPLAILDRVSQGTKYSTRAANAAACVANFAPDQFYDFHSRLLSGQPEESSAGLTDQELIAITTRAQVVQSTKVKTCIEKQSFSGWVAASRDRALTGPIPNSDVKAIQSTPTVIVNGQRYEGAPNDAGAFSAFMVKAAGERFNALSTSTPTPTPTPTETPAAG